MPGAQAFYTLTGADTRLAKGRETRAIDGRIRFLESWNIRFMEMWPIVVSDVTPNGVVGREMVAGMTREPLQALSEAELHWS